MAWTDDKIEDLRTLWDKGNSASQIATQLGEGFTRNSVIGKAHRLGLKSRPSPVKGERKTAAKGRKTGRKGAGKKVEDRVSLLDLTERMCKWPIGHPGEADFHFCGKPSVPSVPYCEAHCKEAFQAQQPRKDRRPPRIRA